MRKDYIPAKSYTGTTDEISFVEDFWTRRWENRSEIPASGLVSRREEYRIMQPYLRALPVGSRILDGGCGMGEWTVFLADQGFEVAGLDISRATISRLKTLLPEYTFRWGDLRRTEFSDSTFDAYFSWGVFEHFENGPGDCIGEAFRILKPGGLLFISVPFHNRRLIVHGTRHRGKSGPPPVLQGNPGHSDRFYQWRFTQPELRRELEDRSFRVHGVRPIAKAQGVHRWMQWDFRLFREGGLPFKLCRRLFTPIMPAAYISHMILAIAQKEETQGERI